MNVLFQFVREILKVINLIKNLDLIPFPMILILSGFKNQVFFNLRVSLYHLKETFFTQCSNCTLILTSYRCSTPCSIQKSYLSKEHPRLDFSHEGILLKLIFNQNFTLTLCQNVEMRGFLTLFNYIVLWLELMRLDIH